MPDVGGEWVKAPGFIGQAYVDPASGRLYGDDEATILYYNAASPPSADYAVAADIALVTGSAAAVGLVVRLDPVTGDCYLARWDMRDGGYTLQKRVGGLWSVLAANPGETPTTGHGYTLRFSIHGQTLTFSRDGVALIGVADATIAAAGRVGVYLDGRGRAGGPQLTGLTARPLAAMAIAPAGVASGRRDAVVTLAGRGTTWTARTVFRVSAGTIAAQRIDATAQVARLTYSAPDRPQVVTFANDADAATAPLTVAVPATGYSLDGPALARPGQRSAPFTVALLPEGGMVDGSATIAPHSSVAGTFSPATVTLSTARPSAVFTFTPAADSQATISTTNDDGLIDPASLTVRSYTPIIFGGDSFTDSDNTVLSSHVSDTGQVWYPIPGLGTDTSSYPKVRSNTLRAAADVNTPFRYSALPPITDYEVQVTAKLSSAGGDSFKLIGRHNPATGVYYHATISASGSVFLEKSDGTVLSYSNNALSLRMGTTYQFKLVLTATQKKIQWKTLAATTWTDVTAPDSSKPIATTDNSYATAGVGGLAMRGTGNNWILDDFRVQSLDTPYDATLPGPFTTPTLANIAVTTLQGNRFVVQWDTDLLTDGKVDYGPTAAYGSSSATMNANPRTTHHSVTVTGLTELTPYHYQVVSSTPGGQTGSSADRTLTTLENGLTPTTLRLDVVYDGGLPGQPNEGESTIGVRAKFDLVGPGGYTAIVKYKKNTESTWRTAHPPFVDTRQDSTVGGHNPAANEARTVIFGLSADTDYDVRVTFQVGTGVRILGGSSVLTGTVHTLDPTPPDPATRTFYVDAARPDDSGDGTIVAAAKKTLHAGLSLLTSPGDCLRIRPGTYRSSATLALPAPGTGNTNGAGGQDDKTGWIRVTSDTQNMDDVIIEGTPGSEPDPLIDLGAREYIRLDHLTIRRASGALIKGDSGNQGGRGHRWVDHCTLTDYDLADTAKTAANNSAISYWENPRWCVYTDLVIKWRDQVADTRSDPDVPRYLYQPITGGVARATRFTGSATAVTATTMTDTAKNFGAAGALVNKYIGWVSGDGVNGVAKITASTATSVTVAGWWQGVMPAPSDRYWIADSCNFFTVGSALWMKGQQSNAVGAGLDPGYHVFARLDIDGGHDGIGGDGEGEAYGPLGFNTRIYAVTGHWLEDDVIQADGPGLNLAIWDVVGDLSTDGLSLNPISLGPVFVLRTIFFRAQGAWSGGPTGGWKIGDNQGVGSDGPCYLYHNVVYQDDAETAFNYWADAISETNPGITNWSTRNNILFGGPRYVWECPDVGAPPGSTWYMDLDYDAMWSTAQHSGGQIKWFGLPTSVTDWMKGTAGSHNWLANADSRITAIQPHGWYRNAKTLDFANASRAVTIATAKADFALKPGSALIDAGQIIVGINSGVENPAWNYRGAGPDVGAVESTRVARTGLWWHGVGFLRSGWVSLFARARAQ